MLARAELAGQWEHEAIHRLPPSCIREAERKLLPLLSGVGVQGQCYPPLGWAFSPQLSLSGDISQT